MRRRYSDRGSATVWSVGAIGVLCVVFGVLLALGQSVAVRHRAAGGADLAALAAAEHWAEGTAGACAQADRVARAQGARLTRCVIVGDVSDVSVASGGGPFTVEVRARAGPRCNAPFGGGGNCATGPHAPAPRQPPSPAPPSEAP
ncbi:Rv3654c family TadE-like protein [Streptomyces sp. NPDC054813]